MRTNLNHNFLAITVLLLFALVSLATPSLFADPAPAGELFYVSGDHGNDANDGRSLNTAFKTLARAKAAVRAFNSGMSSDITVLIAPGVYKLTEPLVFTPEDSGTNGYRVIYRRLGAISPVLCGGEVVEPVWQDDAGGIKKAFIGTGRTFRQLYVNDQRATRAREPNAGRFGTLPVVTENNLANKPDATGIYIEPGRVPASPKPDEIEISVLMTFMNKRLRIQSLAEDGTGTKAIINNIEMDAVKFGAQANRDYSRGWRCFLENAYEFLDMPFEWYYDKATGYLYYYPGPGQALGTASIVIPATDELIRLSGTIEANVSNLVFSGLKFRYTSWNYPSHNGFVDVQASTLIPSAQVRSIIDGQYRHNYRKDRVTAAFQANSASNITIDGCTFCELGGTGATFAEGGVDNTISHNVFRNISGSGIEVGNTAQHPNDPRMIPRRIIIFNNRIATIGTEYAASIGITLFYVDTALVENNTLADMPYSGISAGWGWRSDANTDTKNILIRRNFIQNANRLLDDGGFIYTLNSQANSIVSENYLKADFPTEGRGLYHDEGSGGWLNMNNVVEGQYTKVINFWNYACHDMTLANNYVNILGDPQISVLNNGKNVNIMDLYVDRTSVPNWPEEAREIIRNAGCFPGLETPNLPSVNREHTILLHPDPRISEGGTAAFADATVRGMDNSPVREVSGSVTYSALDDNGDPLHGFYRVSVYKPDFGAWKTTNPNAIDTGVQHEVLLNGRVYATYPWNTTNSSKNYMKVGNYQTQWLNGGWINLGVFHFDGTANNFVRLNRSSTALKTYANAVMFERFTYDDEKSFARQPVYPKGVVAQPNGTDRILIDNVSPNTGYLETGTWANGILAEYRGFTTSNLSSSPSTFRLGANGAGARFTPTIPTGGFFKVYKYVNRVFTDSSSLDTSSLNGDENGKLRVVHSSGSTTHDINFKTGIEGWQLLGIHHFNSGTGGFVEIWNENPDPNARILADAVYFEGVRTPVSIALTGAPPSAPFIEGEPINRALFQIEATYSDGTKEIIELFSMGKTSLALGDVSLEISYLNQTLQVPVTVVAKQLSSIQVSRLPDQTRFRLGQAFSSAGGKLLLSYNNGTAEEVNMMDSMVSGYDPNVPGPQTLQVAYTSGGATKTTSYSIHVADKLLQSLAISTPPTLNAFYVGEKFGVNGRITLTYDDGTSATRDITPDMCSGYNMFTMGTQTVTIRVEDKTTAYSIQIGELNAQTDLALGRPVHYNSTIYSAGKWLSTGNYVRPTGSPTGLFTAGPHTTTAVGTTGLGLTTSPLYLAIDLGGQYDFYANFSRIDFRCLPGTDSTRGPKTWSAFGSNSQALFDATKANGSMTEAIQAGGDSWGTSVLSGSISSSSDSIRSLDFNANARARYLLIKLNGSFYATQTRFSQVSVYGASFISSINVTSPPGKTSYLPGEMFDPSGMAVTAHLANGSSREVSGYTLNKNQLSAGDTNLVISYYGVTTTLPVVVSGAPPSPPTNLVATPNSSTRITLTWTDASSDETGFRVLRSLSPDAGFGEVGTTAANTGTFADNTAAAGTLYYYRVSAYSSGGDSSPAAASATTLTALQSWRQLSFGTAENSGTASNTYDFDRDGLLNLVEYALGSNPLIPEPAASPVGSLETHDGEQYQTLSVTRTAIQPGVTYQVQVGGDLAAWSENVTVLVNTPTLLKVRDNVPVSGAPRRFIRLRVTEL